MERTGQGRLVNFRLLYLVAQLIGVVLIILTLSWILLHLNGLSYDYSTPSLIFNWHPLMMVIGMVFLYGNCECLSTTNQSVFHAFFLAILIYRGFRFGRKRSLKITHATIHGLAFVFSLFGLIAVFDSHNYAVPKIPNLYSLHSWIGLTAIILFVCQYIMGFVCYLFPMLREPFRIFYMPIHIFCGLAGYVLALAAALMGLSEKAFFAMNNYSQMPSQGLLINCIGMLLALFGTLVMYMVTEPR